MKRWLLFVLLSSLPVLAQEVVFKDGFENHAPVIVSVPVSIASLDTLYSYDVDAIDVDGDTLLYLLITSPAGMTIDPVSGLIGWTPDNVGIFSVTVYVADGNGGNAQQSWDITVSEVPDSGFNLSVSLTGTGSGTVASTAVGIDCGAICSKDYLSGTDVELAATATSGSTFSGWGGACSGTGPCNITMDATKVLSANFTLDTLVPSPVDPIIATDIAAATAFLYSGADPIQTGVAPGTIEARRAAVLRGKVRTRDGSALAGVTITILAHPEFGQTTSRADGAFDLAVNGGGLLTVDYQKSDLLPVQRQVNVPWRDYAFAPDVVMIPLDEQVTLITLGNAAMQVARGSPVSDADGERRATILFPAGTTAMLVMPDGSTQPITTLNVRATEYTVGANGPNAMPGELPPTSGYTYAVELSADEALAAGAASIAFGQPVPMYVENFVGFPVGSLVPIGFYDRVRGLWVAVDNGRVIAVVGIAGGMADLDLDGDGIADGAAALAALGVTDAERQSLASLYTPGQQLWRAPIPHFTPWDCNQTVQPPAGALPPDGQECGDACPGAKPEESPKGDPDTECGSVIQCETQALGEVIPLTGSPLSLHYQSDRVPGRRTRNTLKIQLSGHTLPPGVLNIQLEIDIAGRHFSLGFPPQPDLAYTFIWDGIDAYGRKVQGQQKVTVYIGYYYTMEYVTARDFLEPSYNRFGAFPNARGVDGSTVGFFVTSGRTDAPEIVMVRAQDFGLSLGYLDGLGPVGRWGISAHHAYDFVGRTLYLGNGNQRNAEAIGAVISTVAGTGTPGFGGDGGPATEDPLKSPWAIVVGPDGSQYIAETFNNRIRRVGPDGNISTFAGTGAAGYAGDDGPATQAELSTPLGVALGPDGSLYIADLGNNRVRRVGPDGIITTVAGTGAAGVAGDGGPATLAELTSPQGVAMGPDGSLYVLPQGSPRVRRVGPDGTITTVAGTGVHGYSGDGGFATLAKLDAPVAIAVGPDGSLYIADQGLNINVRRVGFDGIISTVAGAGPSGFAGDGGPATAALLRAPSGLTVGSDGTLYIADSLDNRIRRVGTEGIITTIAGDGSAGFGGDGGPATQAFLRTPVALALTPDGSLNIADLVNARIRQRREPLSTYYGNDNLVAAEDGSEVYVFADTGQHLRTLDALTGAVRFEFAYDGANRLASITDGDGNVTSIERDGNGNPSAIVAPFGQITALETNGEGALSRVTNPAGEAVQLSYYSGVAEGLLATRTDPRGNVHQYQYDSLGRLTRDENPAGGVTTLARTDFSDNRYAVTLTSALGLVTTHEVEELRTGDTRRFRTDPAGGQRESLLRTDGSRRVTYPDGTVAERVDGPDPRFGMQAPVLTSLTLTTPGGITTHRTATRTATLSDPSDPMSLTAQTDTEVINGRTYTRQYNGASRTLMLTTPAGRQHQLTLDTKGRRSQTSVAGLTPVQRSYDSQGRLVGLIQGDRTFSYSYSPEGFLSQLTDPLAHSVNLAYDAAGRAIQITRPDAESVQSAYDASGNMVELTPPGRSAHTFSFSPVNLLQSYSPPALPGATTDLQFAYNADRRLTQMTRAGTVVAMGYDAAGRLLSLTSPQESVQATYDAAGRLDTLASGSGIGLAYDKDSSLLTQTSWSGPVAGSVQRTFDNNRWLTSRAINGGSDQTFVYDDDGLLSQAGAMTLQRSAQNGLLTGTTLDQVSDLRNFNGFGEWTSYSVTVGAIPVFSAQYTRDQAGRVIQLEETIEGVSATFTYGYDLAGRLIEAVKNGTTTTVYAYDANSNRLTRTSDGVVSSSSHDAQDRMTQSGATTFAYTAHGDLSSATTGGQTTNYTYDVMGNLRSVTLPDGTQIDYLIDGRGRRIGKKVDGAQEQGFLYQSRLQPLAELDGNNSVVSTFVYGSRPNVPDYMIRGGTTYRIVADHLGSPRLVVDATTGVVAQRLDYDEFGMVQLDTNPGFQPFGFAGGLYDRDTGFVHFGARDYDPGAGRWTGKDPSGLAGGTNLYLYANSDPVNYLDLSGHEAVAAAAGVLGTAVGGGTTFGLGAASAFIATAAIIGIPVAVGILAVAAIIDSAQTAGDGTRDDEGETEGGAPPQDGEVDGGACPNIHKKGTGGYSEVGDKFVPLKPGGGSKEEENVKKDSDSIPKNPWRTPRIPFPETSEGGFDVPPPGGFIP